jgi:hypothetical protein
MELTNPTITSMRDIGVEIADPNSNNKLTINN